MKKKIIVIGPGMHIGGVERSLIGFLESLDANIMDINLFLVDHQGEFMEFIPSYINILPEDKILSLSKRRIVWLFKHGYYFIGILRLYAKMYSYIISKITRKPNVNTLRCNKWLMKFIKKQPEIYDVAFGFYGPYYYLNNKVIAKKKFGWIHTDYSASDVGVNANFENEVWQKLDRIVCVSKSCKNSFLNIFPNLAFKVIVIENIISSSFVLEQSTKFVVDDEMPKDGSINILSIGRFCTAKAFDEAVIICKNLIEKGYHIKWYIIGYGPDNALICREVRKHKMQKYFIILGKKANPYPYIRNCDLYVQPSRYEGKAVTVIEAQILGKPVLISNFATATDQLKNGFDGWICPLGIDGVTKGIQYMLDNPLIMKKIAMNALSIDYSYLCEKKKINEAIQ